MPTSNLYLAGEIVAMVDQIDHGSVLDVGPGWGKYATLVREYCRVAPHRIDAVEMWEPYVADHRLDRLYDGVIIGDVTTVADDVLNRYDVVLMVDVIEHIEKMAAMALLDRICTRVVICTPVGWFDNDPNHEHPPTEEHVSHWTQPDWSAFGDRVEVCYQSLGGWLVRLGPVDQAHVGDGDQ